MLSQRLRDLLSHVVEARQTAEWHIAPSGQALAEIEVCLGPGRCTNDGGTCEFCFKLPKNFTSDDITGFVDRVRRGH